MFQTLDVGLKIHRRAPTGLKGMPLIQAVCVALPLNGALWRHKEQLCQGLPVIPFDSPTQVQAT